LRQWQTDSLPYVCCFQGVSIAFYERFVTQEDARFLKQAGFNHVRASFNWRLSVTEGEPRRLEGVGYDCLDRLVQWCRAEGLYVILDRHGAPGGQTGDNVDDRWGYPFLYECPESQVAYLARRLTTSWSIRFTVLNSLSHAFRRLAPPVI